MKNLLNIAKFSLLFGVLIAISSCNNEPDISDVSRITYFPEFAYEGGDVSLIPCNSDYEISPVTATEGGSPLPVEVETTGILGPVPSVDINKADIYVETSSAVNQDGYAGEVVRTFWVACTGDLVTSIEGLYVSNVVRTNVVNPQYFGLEYVLIRKVGADVYEISDAIGGYYDLGRAYGAAYRAIGMTITAMDIPGNNFTFGAQVPVGAFGGNLKMNSFSVDPAARKITFQSEWDSPHHFFDVELTQVAL